MQILLNIVYTGFIYYLVSSAFSITFTSSKFFDITFAAFITIGGYLFFLFNQQLDLNIILSLIITVILCLLLVVIKYNFFLKPLINRKSSSLILLIASLGIYIIIQNAISLIWGDATLNLYDKNVEVGYVFLNSHITNIQILTILVGFFVFVFFNTFFSFSKPGKELRAISSNQALSNIFGINTDRILLIGFSISSIIAVFTGILIGYETNLQPTMGFNIFIFGIVAMIIGGIHKHFPILASSFLLASIQHIISYYFDNKWMDSIAYIILILFLIWKPLGISGKQLKKIEI